MRLSQLGFVAALLLAAACAEDVNEQPEDGGAMSRRFTSAGGARRPARESVSAAPASGAPTSVSAGSDANFDMLSASPCSLSGSAVGATSYLWTNTTPLVGTVTFADATNPLSTLIVSADGVYVLDLAATNASGTTHDQMTLTVTATLAALLTRMATGSRVNVWYQVGIGETLDGSNNYSALNNQGADTTLHLAQATSGLRPSKVTNGGPGGTRDCLTLQDTNRAIFKSAASMIGTGKFLYFTTVAKMNATDAKGAAYVWGPVRVVFWNYRNTGVFAGKKFCSGDAASVTLTSGTAADTNWARFDQRYIAGVVPVVRRNGTALAAPAFTGGVGACDTAIDNIYLGLGLGNSGGSVYTFGIFENVSTAAGAACLSEQGAIDYYQDRTAGFI